MSKLQKKLFFFRSLDRKIFFALFSVVGFAALQIPFNKVMGSNVSFTLFDFFAPMAGAFLGPVFGIISVFGVLITNMLIKDTLWTTGAIIRLFPTLFAVLYFALASRKKFNGKWLLAVPVLSIIAFIAHPIGRTVPHYALMFWLIPVVAYFKRDNLFMRSLGSTFTAHAVGGAAWIWAFSLPAAVWNGLIPVVIAERLLFASGIAASYVIVNHSLSFLIKKRLLPKLEIAS